ncbi:hypothetical protein ALC56_09903 [Trachymyrmex septentrionalis]|uniref:GIY-YIG domain-containing protein n=1 Tax=Trachymyrmex septentrionalis TaxID=34720 RepID=A0A151JU32_9HYME|nr:hypothetical protein ALC56_09903 [Trachymyrmex septentrionalis]
MLTKRHDNFCLPVCNVQSVTIDFIKNIEYNIRKMQMKIPDIMDIRNKILQLINNIKQSKTFIEKQIGFLFCETKKFIKNNQDILFTHKGNVVVNVLTNLMMEGINKRWHLIQPNTSSPKQRLILKVQFVFNSTYFTFDNELLYIKNNKFRGFINNISMKLSFFSFNKLNKFIRAHKDRLPDSSKRNVVYRINCNDYIITHCDSIYVRQTERQLKTRISQHRSHINRNTTTHSVITDHRLHHCHDFCWKNVKILENERNYNKRFVSEMINIKQQNNSINLKTDTELLY